ncbi:MAG: HAMP domain-containing methyl-accepting chemotaxis protein [Armatimonadota bacterium]
MLNNMKLGAKLTAAFLLVAGLAVVLGIIGYRALGMVSGRYDELASEDLPGIENILTLREAELMVIAAERGLINERWMDPTLRNAQYRYIDKAWEKANAAWSLLDSGKHTDEEKAGLEKLKEAWNAWKAEHEVVRSLSEQKDRLVSAGASLDSRQIEDLDKRTFAKALECRTAYLAVDEALASALELLRKSGLANVETARTIARRQRGLMLVVMLICALAAVGLGVATSRAIAGPVARTTEMIQEMGKGHLDMRLNLDRGDEIGVMARTMDQFAENLQKYIARGMQRIADGDLTVETPVMDDRDEIGPALRRMVEALRGLAAECEKLSRAAAEGQLSVRADAAKFSGAYRQIIQGINDTLDAVMGPVNEALVVMEKRAARDLSARITGEYKGDFQRMKEALNTAAQNLDEALQQVAVAAEQVATASDQVQSGSQALAQGASEQASSLEEVSSSLQEMTSMANQTASNTQEGRGLAESARATATKGVESMGKLVAAVERIKKSSDEQSKVVKTIDEIAFQTNLLALNAAVEAARAGEAGKGFAVVAEEVRNLAMRSAEAAKNVSAMIEESTRTTEEGVRINEEVAQNLQEIAQQVNRVAEVMGEIAAATEQQNQGISQVNVAVEQMNQVTQQTAANSEESAAAAEELAGQAQELRAMVQGFRLSREVTSGKAKRQKAVVLAQAKAPAKKPLSAEAEALIPFDNGDEEVLRTF